VCTSLSRQRDGIRAQLKEANSMRIISALIGAGLIVGIATAGIAQTTPAPTPNPNTKVYAYKQTAPAKAKTQAAIQQSRPDEAPVYGSPKWWEMQSRFSGSEGAAGGP
jgi:hypothetical protein